MSKTHMHEIQHILEAYKTGDLALESAQQQLSNAYIKDIGHTALDAHRQQRVGAAEVVYGEGKSTEQLRQIFATLSELGQNILATRVSEDNWKELQSSFPMAKYHRSARSITLLNHAVQASQNPIAVITAGTSDLPVADEAAVCAEFYGNPVIRINDVGVAGIHRLIARLDDINKANVVIVVAGMEGALPSVVGGLVKRPIIAVPTSVGYGASFGGISALLGMLNSCASGVSVVNIDNGFGAGYQAALINESINKSITRVNPQRDQQTASMQTIDKEHQDD